MHPIGKSDQAQEHRQDHKAKGVLLKVKVPKEPQGPEDSDDRRCGDHQDDRQAAKQDRSHQQDHAIADGLITNFVVPVVLDQYQTQRNTPGDMKLHRHTRMLLGDLPSGSQNRLGTLGVILDIEPVVLDLDERRLGVARKHLTDDQRMRGGFFLRDIEPLLRGVCAREDRFAESEDVQWGSLVERSDRSDLGEPIDSVDHVAKRFGAFGGEDRWRLDDQDRFGPPPGSGKSSSSPNATWTIGSRGFGVARLRRTFARSRFGLLGAWSPSGLKFLWPGWIAVASDGQASDQDQQP